MKIKHLVFFMSLVFVQLQMVAQKSSDEQLASQYYQNKEFDKALDYYEKLYNKKSKTLFYTAYLNCLLKTENFKKAEKVAKKQIKLNAGKPDYIVDLGAVYLHNDDIDKAASTWKQAIKAIRYDEQTFAVAKSFLAIRQYDLAVNTYLRGRRVSPNRYLFAFELAEVFLLKGDKLAMINEYLEVLASDDSYIDAVQNALQTSYGINGDAKQNQLLKTELLKRISRNPDKTIFSELLIWMQMQQKDFEGAFIQAKALDRRNKEEGNRLMKLAKLAADNKNYDLAKRAYQYVIDKGEDNDNYIFAKMEQLNVAYKKVISQSNYTTEELEELEKKYQSAISEIGNIKRIAPLLKNLAHLQAFYLNRPTDAINLLETAVSSRRLPAPVQADLKLELADILLVSGDIWEASLRYSQVEKKFKYDAIGQEAKFRNAKISYYTGDFKWAQAQLDVLKGATAKLISNDAMDLSLLISDALAIDTNVVPLEMFSRADLFLFQNKNDEAIVTLDSISTLFPNHALVDEVIYKKALVEIKRAKYTEAVKLLENIVLNHSFDILGDDALFMLAEINEIQLKNTDKAKELYQQLLENYPGSLYVVDARKRFRKLRGDNLN